MNKRPNTKKGFSLVELVVSLALFGVIIVSITGAMLVVIDGNKKSKALISSLDSLNFAMESITRELRVGSDFDCIAPVNGGTGDCDGGDDIMGFTSSEGFFVVYRINTNTNRIERCGEPSAGDCPNIALDANYIPLTGDSILINTTETQFYVQGSTPGVADGQQPRVTIVVTGVAGSGDTASAFRVQTTVTQRFPDV